ncbi:hypothetical protein ACU10_15580 [Xanthomonas oryzae pv. oryzicola]|uniref:SUKH-4 family immunity protein n=1 Tax=Xanthomonas oryzae TaxID=347 RepID=UPI000655AA74|nr:SUKH-4 family immunity protein [Xanthomonas oryzae]AKN94242.1 hypothetical protein ACU13_15650 [Xanthomonas oryzae pv. oryzicola]AKN97967.1 hypothetical protein ACU10_15580 [Xanthomonas oryzae pv. oryzicola]AKO13192.1 hypothetical protein ACU14_15575 [Xanthomonas oryzae pv. oryzicola]AKO16932.1 hypothetical protein ACU12_15635 [Xanthomonas oryzae pv. oryzicola]
MGDFMFEIKSVEKSKNIFADRALVDGFELPDESESILIDHGLPGKLEPPVLGLSFVKPFKKVMSDRSCLVFASEEWAPDLWIALNDSGEVYAVNGDKCDVFVNSTLAKFLAFVGKIQQFLIAAKVDDTGPIVRSQAEMRERLEAMRRGEVRPVVKRKVFNRKSAISELNAEFKEIDSTALQGESWWSRILEQLNEGLL